MNITRSGICSDVAFHSETPFVALLCLVHFRISGFFLILRGTWCIDNRCVYNRTAFHHCPALFKNIIDSFEHLLSQMILFQKMSEFQKCCSVRNLFLVEINTHEFSECIAVINGIFDTFIRKIKPYLKKIHSKHLFNSFCGSATPSVRIIWSYKFYPLIPWNNIFHYIEKFFSFGLFLSVAVFKIAKCHLAHFLRSYAFSFFPYYSIVYCLYNSLF